MEPSEVITLDCPPLSVPEDQPAEEVKAGIAWSVEYVEVIGPSDRDDSDDGLCCIYGKIIIWDKYEEFAPVTLFDRSRDKAETIYLAEPDFRFLTLADDDSARPLHGGYPIFVKMKLREKLPDNDSEENDPVIAQVDFKFERYNYKTNKRVFFEFECESGFCIYMGYTTIFGGVFAQVELTIIKDIPREEEEKEKEETTTAGNKLKQPIQSGHIYGTIVATQSLDKGVLPIIKLCYITSHDPREVNKGSPIKLDRKLVVAPTGGGILGISYTLYNAANHQLIAESIIPFRVQRHAFKIRVPKDLTYTKEAEDGLISASVRFVPFTYPQRPPSKPNQSPWLLLISSATTSCGNISGSDSREIPLVSNCFEPILCGEFVLSALQGSCVASLSSAPRRARTTYCGNSRNSDKARVSSRLVMMGKFMKPLGWQNWAKIKHLGRQNCAQTCSCFGRVGSTQTD